MDALTSATTKGPTANVSKKAGRARYEVTIAARISGSVAEGYARLMGQVKAETRGNARFGDV